MKQSIQTTYTTRQGENTVSEFVWETFDGLFKTVYRQNARVEALEQRIADLERRLLDQQSERALGSHVIEPHVAEFPVERAA
jgi:hypothetical protein